MVNFTTFVKSKRKRKKDITFQDIQENFDLPIKEAADALQISLTQLKRICRENDIPRWPYRKLQALQNKLQDLQDSLAQADELTKQRTQSKIDSIHEEIKFIRAYPKTIIESGGNGGKRNSITKSKRWSLPSMMSGDSMSSCGSGASTSNILDQTFGGANSAANRRSQNEEEFFKDLQQRLSKQYGGMPAGLMGHEEEEDIDEDEIIGDADEDEDAENNKKQSAAKTNNRNKRFSMPSLSHNNSNNSSSSNILNSLTPKSSTANHSTSAFTTVNSNTNHHQLHHHQQQQWNTSNNNNNQFSYPTPSTTTNNATNNIIHHHPIGNQYPHHHHHHPQPHHVGSPPQHMTVQHQHHSYVTHPQQTTSNSGHSHAYPPMESQGHYGVVSSHHQLHHSHHHQHQPQQQPIYHNVIGGNSGGGQLYNHNNVNVPTQSVSPPQHYPTNYQANQHQPLNNVGHLPNSSTQNYQQQGMQGHQVINPQPNQNNIVSQPVGFGHPQHVTTSSAPPQNDPNNQAAIHSLHHQPLNSPSSSSTTRESGLPSRQHDFFSSGFSHHHTPFSHSNRPRSLNISTPSSDSYGFTKYLHQNGNYLPSLAQVLKENESDRMQDSPIAVNEPSPFSTRPTLPPVNRSFDQPPDLPNDSQRSDASKISQALSILKKKNTNASSTSALPQSSSAGNLEQIPSSSFDNFQYSGYGGNNTHRENLHYLRKGVHSTEFEYPPLQQYYQQYPDQFMGSQPLTSTTHFTQQQIDPNSPTSKGIDDKNSKSTNGGKENSSSGGSKLSFLENLFRKKIPFIRKRK
ncbi:RWP-RK domain-containing protein [Naegleria gruberi]|uniref:RWP-RK domain-containing protein n=1 Tax=Naegleria gruberi TaxID=5762 RepID=D2V1Q1_NAEGR|nr:RWP-RK domain-containing protein [Naegleria gruberi]EFC49200.1 RWP-RK domain-containing protein [Naegleria gruberi]|eukprot:XP_002681944.1 RWP-RK domain-containing protein [Naegleria gruberi strain NEG-M]